MWSMKIIFLAHTVGSSESAAVGARAAGSAVWRFITYSEYIWAELRFVRHLIQDFLKN